MSGISHVSVCAAGKHSRRSGDIKDHTGLNDASSQRIGSRITRSGCD